DHSSYPLPGDTLRAAQLVLGHRGGEFRANYGIRGKLTLLYTQPPDNGGKVRFVPTFTLPSDESDSTHCTIIQWPSEASTRAIVMWDLAASAIRRTPDSVLADTFERWLPYGPKGRWRGLMRAGNQELIKGAMWQARGVSPEKFNFAVLENV